MPPCFDVYVWVAPRDGSATLERFLTQHVDRTDPGDPRFDAFVRTYTVRQPLPGDAEMLADLRRDPSAGTGFSLYLRARRSHGAIVTITEEGDVVLGLRLDDPMNDLGVEREAAAALARLIDEFNGLAGIGGAELPPPQSRQEWADAWPVTLRVGSV